MPERNLPTDLLESPGYQLWLAGNAWQRAVRTALEPLGVTQVQYAVLAAVRRLSEAGEPVTQADVCRFGSLDANMASQVVRGLEERGLLVRLPHPTDRRANELRLSVSGEKMAEACRGVVRPLIEAFFAPLGHERRELARMLRAINGAHE